IFEIQKFMDSEISKPKSSVLFCSECGNLLNIDGEDMVTCNSCMFKRVTTEFEDIVITTKSNPKNFPSKLRLKRSRIKQLDVDKEESASIKEKCPNCGNEEMNYHTMQLRSADEGQTIFYNCTRCG
ncbi:7969_t:CDS:2, partial [Acaulospora morrowiae]